MPEPDALGAQYREAKTSIGLHRQRQAAAEVAFAAGLRRHGGDRAPVTDLQAAVDKAVSDVEWCKAVTLAAGEAVKGQSFNEIVARNETGRETVATLPQRAALIDPPTEAG